MDPMIPNSFPEKIDEKSSRAWFVILIVVFLVVVAFVVYYWRLRGLQSSYFETLFPPSVTSNSDEVPAIEKDLNATSLDGLDKELSDIDRELGTK